MRYLSGFRVSSNLCTPLAVTDDPMYNLISHACIVDEFVPQIQPVDVTGQKLYEDYITEVINGDVGILEPAQKQNNKISHNKKQIVKICDMITDMKETRYV